MMLHRRKFLMGLGALMAAPAIVSVSNIMPVKAALVPVTEWDLVVGDFGNGRRAPVGTVGFEEYLKQFGRPEEMNYLNSIAAPWKSPEYGLREDLLAAFKEHGL
jgi:hypothetical protein